MSSNVILDGELLHDDDNPDLDAEFAAFRDSIAQDQQAEGFIKVWRLPLDKDGNARSNSMQQSELFTLPLGESSIDDLCDRVRRKYMRPDEFKITICVRGYQRGKRGIRFQRIMALERENTDEKPSANNTTGDVAAMLRLIQESSEAAQIRTEAFMREMMMMQRAAPVSSAPVAIDPIGMLQQVGTMMTVFQGMMSGMMRPPGEAGDPMSNFVRQLEQMKKVQSLLGVDGGGDKDEGTLGIVKALTPLAKPVLEMLAAQAQAQPMRRRQLPRPAPAPTPQPAKPAPKGAPVQPAPVSPPQRPEPEILPEENQVQLKDALNALCDMAARGDNAVTAARLALDMLPEEFDAQVGALVSEPATFLPKLKLLCPRTAGFPEWFEELRSEMALAFEEDPDADPEADDGDGDGDGDRDDQD